jgi:hypothetical protein
VLGFLGLAFVARWLLIGADEGKGTAKKRH